MKVFIRLSINRVQRFCGRCGSPRFDGLHCEQGAITVGHTSRPSVAGPGFICAYSHPGRVRSEAAFAALTGVAPRPASSGNTTRHRLNRSGDRQLNRAFDIIARTRMSYDTTTRNYVTTRRTVGKTNREIRRSLKRYICRQIFHQINTIMS